MTNEQFNREKIYSSAMVLAAEMLRKGIITKADYRRIEKHFKHKYSPVIGGSYLPDRA